MRVLAGKLFVAALLGGAVSASLALPRIFPAAPITRAVPGRPAIAEGRAAKPLRILFLGGTGFIGPHMVRYALYRGHIVSLFNRGKTHPELFPDVEKLRGELARHA